MTDLLDTIKTNGFDLTKIAKKENSIKSEERRILKFDKSWRQGFADRKLPTHKIKSYSFIILGEHDSNGNIYPIGRVHLKDKCQCVCH